MVGGRFILKSTIERGSSEGASKNIIGDSDDRNIGVSRENLISLSSSQVQKNNFEGGEAKNTFNCTDIVGTPKRKKASAVSELVFKFSGASTIQPGLDMSESPAKRRRVWGQGGQGH